MSQGYWARTAMVWELDSDSGVDSDDLPPEAGRAPCALAVCDEGSSTCKKQIDL
jgi:hypothetical protein